MQGLPQQGAVAPPWWPFKRWSGGRFGMQRPPPACLGKRSRGVPGERTSAPARYVYVAAYLVAVGACESGSSACRKRKWCGGGLHG